MSQQARQTYILPKYQMLGYPQSDVSFQIDTAAKTLFMTDLDQNGRSLTNDMGNALCRVIFFQKQRGEQFAPDEYTILYQDSEGSIDGVEVSLKAAKDAPLRSRLIVKFYPIGLNNLPVCLSR